MADDSSGLKPEELERTIQEKERQVIHEFSGFKAPFDDCLDLISKARGDIKDNKLVEANDTVLRLEARIKTAAKSRELLGKRRWWIWIGLWDLVFFVGALIIGWCAICGPYLPCRACDNATQADVAAPAGQNPAQNAAAAAAPLTLINWLVLGFSAGILGGVVISMYGLVDHGVKGDFSEDYKTWYWYKPIKGGLSGAVAVLPFIAGLAVFKIESTEQIQTTIAYITIASFLVGYCERYFFQLLNRVGTIIFKPSNSTESGNNKPS